MFLFKLYVVVHSMIICSLKIIVLKEVEIQGSFGLLICLFITIYTRHLSTIFFFMFVSLSDMCLQKIPIVIFSVSLTKEVRSL